MPPAPLAEAVLFIHPGSTRIYWVVTIANPAAPTRLELDAGVDVTGAVVDVAGWRVSRNTRDKTAYGDDFELSIEGLARADDSWLVFQADRTGGDIAQTLPEGTEGHVVILYGGDVAGNPMSVWPVRAVAISRPVDVDGIPAVVGVQFVIRAQPERELAVPV